MPDINASKIEFIEYHQPAVPDGDYTIGLEQTLVVDNRPVSGGPFRVQKTFAVAGPRFGLAPAEIQARFPPPGSLGDHANVLPHVIFNRSTLPWERLALPLTGQETPEEESVKRGIPWLALLLFDKDEAPAPQVLSLSELQQRQNYTAYYPTLTLESWQHPDDKVAVIDVPRARLEQILPATVADLALAAHVRQTKNEAGEIDGPQVAVVVCNRLPQQGHLSVVHLVSLENRYQNSDGYFDYEGAAVTDEIRLVTLASWQFACVDDTKSFKGLLEHSNHTPATFRLPVHDNPQAEAYLAQSYVPCPHRLREGSKTFSWYRGPLISGLNETEPATLPLPARAADQLLRYEPQTGLFNTAYAAAWELGRLVTLHNKRVALALFNWKRGRAQQLRQAEQALLHFPIRGQGGEGEVEVPPIVKQWFYDLSLLRGIPFNYLIPDEALLPPESLRFFVVDRLWQEALLDGAFSIGRVTAQDQKRDGEKMRHPAAELEPQLSGFLLRSEVVSGWPGLMVDAYDQVIDSLDFVPAVENLPLLRMERLTPHTLLCLFGGALKTLDIHLKPEVVHFGVSRQADDPTRFYKVLRDRNGLEDDALVVAIPWHSEPSRVVDLAALASRMQAKVKQVPFTSAQFALQLVEGVQKVRFTQ